jgi:hypothetical protein
VVQVVELLVYVEKLEQVDLTLSLLLLLLMVRKRPVLVETVCSHTIQIFLLLTVYLAHSKTVALKQAHFYLNMYSWDV